MVLACSEAFTAEARSKKKSKARTEQTSKKKGKKSSKKEKSSKSAKSKSKKGRKAAEKKSSRKSSKGRSHSSSRSHSRASRWTRHTEAPAETASSDSLTLLVNNAVLSWVPDNLNPGGLRVNLVKPDMQAHTVDVRLNDNFTYLPVTSDFITELQSTVRHALPDSLRQFRPTLSVGSKSLSYYISKIDKLPQKYRTPTQFVRQAEPDAVPAKGMHGDIIAMWPSHGRYFKNGGWNWQRPFLYETSEDIYTMSYVLPFLVPMVENAGAYVMLPRERDINRHEVIVDNDRNPDGQLFSQPYYKEKNGAKPWANGEEDGFIYDLPDFRDTENPFEVGTYRQTRTVAGGAPSTAAWYADIPEDGEYAVYVSYKSLPESTADARYTVKYSGGSKDFLVNQQMGGSTWIYLGTFPLQKGYSDVEPVVMLTNRSATPGRIVTADAVKIGGGMGNIARSPRRADVFYDPSTPEAGLDEDADDEGDEEGDEEDSEETVDGDDQDRSQSSSEETPQDVDQEQTPAEAPKAEEPAKPKRSAPVFRTSGLPRYLEGARYWLHWAGMPEEVYSPYHGRDDYKDDYTSRALWVNYLAGGSRVLPKEEGLGIPVDAVFALHTDAGKRSDDTSTVGTLGIYYTQHGGNYDDGTPRINSRMLTDAVMRQIVSDIRQTYNPDWKRRSMWDKSYVEARIPEVPTTLIELLSHQNFGDMLYGLDPGFRFLVSRAIYKGIARFMSERKDRKLVIQPLPVHDFAITRRSKGHYSLSWKPTADPLEPTAKPRQYIIYERREGDLGFHKIGMTSSDKYEVKVTDTQIHSFRVVAVNDGGSSFPSETLAMREGGSGKPVLIINGFTRVSGPGVISDATQAGFDSQNDFGVPYIRDISFSGHQNDMRRSSSGHGSSSSNYVSDVIAGNTFDYPAVHGQAVASAGLGFVSASVGAVEAGMVPLKNYEAVDLILGKQKEGKVGIGKSGWNYKTFSPKLQKLLRDYVGHGGDLLVSGEYVASDLTSPRSSQADRDFAAQILGVEAGQAQKPRTARFTLSDDGTHRASFTPRSYAYSGTLNADRYIVESPDMLQPIGEADYLMEFEDADGAAAVASKRGRSHVVVMSVPFEAITAATDRNALMKEILNFFAK